MSALLTPAPTIGLPADEPYAATDRVVLNSYCGRPTLVVLEVVQAALLAWMLSGYVDDVETWLYVRLTAAELDDFYAATPPLIGQWLKRLPARDAYIGAPDDRALPRVLTRVLHVRDAADYDGTEIALAALIAAGGAGHD